MGVRGGGRHTVQYSTVKWETKEDQNNGPYIIVHYIYGSSTVHYRTI